MFAVTTAVVVIKYTGIEVFGKKARPRTHHQVREIKLKDRRSRKASQHSFVLV